MISVQNRDRHHMAILVQVDQEADIKTAIDIKETYWGKCLGTIKAEGSRERKESFQTTGEI